MELLQIGIFERFVAANTPKKYQMPLKLLFLDGKQIGFMQIRSLSKKLHGRQQPRCGGGSPSPNFPAYSQLDEMPHVFFVRIDKLRIQSAETSNSEMVLKVSRTG